MTNTDTPVHELMQVAASETHPWIKFYPPSAAGLRHGSEFIASGHRDWDEVVKIGVLVEFKTKGPEHLTTCARCCGPSAFADWADCNQVRVVDVLLGRSCNRWKRVEPDNR